MTNCSTGFHGDPRSELDESRNKTEPIIKTHNQIVRKPVTPFNACSLPRFCLQLWRALADKSPMRADCRFDIRGSMKTLDPKTTT